MMLKQYVWLRNLIDRREGQGLTEYAIIIGLVALVVIGVVTGLGTKIQALFQSITSQLP